MKICFKCGIQKELSEFYKHAQMADGHLNKCKVCTRSDSNRHRVENIDAVREYDRKRSDLPHRKEVRRKVAERWKNDPALKKRSQERHKAWRLANRERDLAHRAVNHAIERHGLLRQPCEVCGEAKVEAHHDDYSKPLDIRWLCRFHHVEHHKEERRIARLLGKKSVR